MQDGARYSRVMSRFWGDEKVLVWDDDMKLLALYILTCPHGNMLGCFRLPKLYICEDLRWDAKRLDKPFAKLLEEEFMKYDEEARSILIKNYLIHNPIENENQAKAAVKKLKELPKSQLLSDLKLFIERLDKPFLELLAKQIGEPVTVSVTVTETVTASEESQTEKQPEEKTPPFNEIVDLYHGICAMLPRVRKLTKTRKTHIAARWKEMPDIEAFRRLFEMVIKSDFLTNRLFNNRNDWKADFDWLMQNDQNYIKVFEGKYDNKQPGQPKLPDVVPLTPEKQAEIEDLNKQLAEYGLED